MKDGPPGQARFLLLRRKPVSWNLNCAPAEEAKGSGGALLSPISDHAVAQGSQRAHLLLSKATNSTGSGRFSVPLQHSAEVLAMG